MRLLLIAKISAYTCWWRLGCRDYASGLSIVVRFLHKEEEEYKCKGEEDCRPVKDPLPALTLCNKAANYGGEVIAYSWGTCISCCPTSSLGVEIDLLPARVKE